MIFPIISPTKGFKPPVNQATWGWDLFWPLWGSDPLQYATNAANQADLTVICALRALIRRKFLPIWRAGATPWLGLGKAGQRNR